MNPIGSNSIASQIYNGIQSKLNPLGVRTNQNSSGSPAESTTSFKLPNNATPRGDWVLSENANPQSFEADSPRGSYLNIVV